MKPLTTYKQSILAYKQSILDYDTLDRSTISTSMNLKLSPKKTHTKHYQTYRTPIENTHSQETTFDVVSTPHFTRSKPSSATKMYNH